MSNSNCYCFHVNNYMLHLVTMGLLVDLEINENKVCQIYIGKVPSTGFKYCCVVKKKALQMVNSANTGSTLKDLRMVSLSSFTFKRPFEELFLTRVKHWKHFAAFVSIYSLSQPTTFSVIDCSL